MVVPFSTQVPSRCLPVAPINSEFDMAVVKYVGLLMCEKIVRGLATGSGLKEILWTSFANAVVSCSCFSGSVCVPLGYAKTPLSSTSV